MKRLILCIRISLLLLLVETVSAHAQNFWQQTNGPYGGTILSLTITPSGSLFAGTDGGGVFRSLDNGESWVQVGLANSVVLALDANSSGAIFAGTSNGGLFRSTNNGGSWTQTGLVSESIRSLAISQSGTIFAGGWADVFTFNSTVFRSTNSGATWTQTSLTVEDEIGTLFINSSGHIFAGACADFFCFGGGLYRSVDNGSNWTVVTVGLTSKPVASLAMNSSGDLFAGTGGGVFRSTNNGANWAQTGLSNAVKKLAINASGQIFAGTAAGMYRSTDAGMNWTAVNVGLTNRTVRALLIDTTGNVFAGTGGGGVFRSIDNGGTWAQINNGLSSSRIQSLAIYPNGQAIAGADIGIFLSTDNGGTWTAANVGLTNSNIRSVALTAAGNVFAGVDAGVFRSTDSTNSWTLSGLSFTSVSTLSVSSSGSIFAGTATGIFRSTNNGGSWVQVGLASTNVNTIVVQSSSSIFAGTNSSVFRSTDDGASWTQTGLTSTAVQSLTVNSSGAVLAGTNNGVYRSVNNGVSWTQVGLTTSSVWALSVNASDHVFAGTEKDGVFLSTDNGASWNAFSTELTNSSILALAISASGFLYAGSSAGGVFRTVQTTLPVTTDAATNISTSSATLTGTVNPSGLPTTAFFEWGTSSTLSSFSATQAQSLGSGITPVAVTADLGGLSPSTTYYFRIVSQSSVGTRRGSIRSFSTSANLPTLTTGVASSVTSSSATLNGNVNPNGSSSSALFEWGTTNTLATFTSTSLQSIGSGTSVVAVTVNLTGLSGGTTYYYRVVGQNSAGTSKGSILSFTTSATVTSTTLHVNAITGNDASAGTASAPLRNIQTALTRASSGDTVKVAAGTYAEILTTAVKVVLRGGYDPTFSESTWNLIKNKTFVKPTSGTILSDGNSSTVDGFVFDGSGGAGKGVLVTAGNSMISHNVVQGISASGGSCIEVASTATATVKNNTTANSLISGGGVIVYAIYIKGNAAGTGIVQNNISYNNDVGIAINASGVTAGYNCSYGHKYSFDVGASGPTDLAKDPRFVNAPSGDFRLKASSPSINAGNPSDAVGTEPSPNGGRIDMGAYGGTSNATPNGNPTTYVATTGNDLNNGSISAPFKTIQTALNNALGDTVKVAAGSYGEGIITGSQAILLGGYDNTFADSKRDIFVNLTTLLGVSTSMVFDRFGSTVDGLYLNGNGVSGTGFNISTGSVVTHNVIVNVTVSSGFAIQVNGNSTVVNNTVRSCTYGVYVQSGSGTIVKNNIIANGSFGFVNTVANGIARYNDLFSNSFNYSGSFTTPGTGDLAVNPQFRSASTNDYRLAANSPCIDAGDPTDPVGNEPSLNNTRIDMGAYGGTKNAGAPTVTPTTIALSSGNNQSIRINTALTNPMLVLVTGTGGVPVGGVSVTFAITSAPAGATGQSLSATSTTTNSSGQASSTLTIGSKLGTYTVTATSSGLTGSPVSFTATGTAGPAATMQLTSGNNQSGALNTALPNPFVVTVTDAGGNVVQGTSVTFALTSTLGGSLSSTNATTNSGGQALTTLTFGGSAGTYTVIATSAGLSGSPVTFTATATGLAPTVSTVAPTNITTTASLLKGTVNPNGLSTTVTFQYGITTGYGSTATATQSPVSGSSSTSVSAALSSLSSGTTYHYRVVAVNSAGTANGTDQTFVTYSGSYTAATTVSFPSKGSASSYAAADYRIIGLPGASGASVSSILSGAQNVDWQVYRDNGAASNFLQPHDGSATFNFTVGRAFWVISKTGVNINRAVTAATLNANQEVDIPLQSGWNLITNPFTSSIAWSKIQTTNGTTGSLYSFNGSFSSSTSFDPYAGYYYFNGSPNPPLSVLRVPYASIFGKRAETTENNPGSWKVNVVLRSGEATDPGVWLGIDSEARQALDIKDLRKPRGVGALLEAYFERPEWDAQYTAFASDIRPNVGEVERWEFTVNTPDLKRSFVTLGGVNAVPDYLAVYLVDEARAKYIDMRKDSVYEFVPAIIRSRFSVLVGRQSAVSQKLLEVLPRDFVLEQNFPNPFNPSTTIPVSVPFASRAELVVYNVLGQKIKTLYSGSLEAGRYWFPWDGRDETGSPATSGMYVYRLSVVGDKTRSGKMVLLK